MLGETRYMVAISHEHLPEECTMVWIDAHRFGNGLLLKTSVFRLPMLFVSWNRRWRVCSTALSSSCEMLSDAIACRYLIST